MRLELRCWLWIWQRANISLFPSLVSNILMTCRKHFHGIFFVWSFVGSIGSSCTPKSTSTPCSPCLPVKIGNCAAICILLSQFFQILPSSNIVVPVVRWRGWRGRRADRPNRTYSHFFWNLFCILRRKDIRRPHPGALICSMGLQSKFLFWLTCSLDVFFHKIHFRSWITRLP